MKKEKFNYYNEFITNINYALESAKILNDYISDFDSTKSAKKEEMVHNLENDADKNLHNILNYLVKDFIPPIDREDIIEISNSIDDLEDCIDDVVIKINTYKITKLRPNAKQFTELILECCQKLKNLFTLFKNSKNYTEMHNTIVEVNQLEEVGDSIHQNAISELFTNESNPIEITRWLSLYNTLEDCLDQAEAVANTLESIVMKLS